MENKAETNKQNITLNPIEKAILEWCLTFAIAFSMHEYIEKELRRVRNGADYY